MYLFWKKLDTTFIINEKDHVLILQKKRKLFLHLLIWNSEITLMERNLIKKSPKNVNTIYNVSKNSISGVTSVFTIKSKYLSDISSSNQEKIWIYSEFFKDDEISSDSNHSKIRAQSKRFTFKRLFQFNQKIEWILDLGQDIKEIWPQGWGQGRKEDQTLILKMMVSINSLLCLRFWHYDAII